MHFRPKSRLHTAATDTLPHESTSVLRGPGPSPALEQSRTGSIRIGPILAIPAVQEELGVKPQRAYSRAGVSLALFRDPDARVPFETAGRLFRESAIHRGRRSGHSPRARDGDSERAGDRRRDRR